MAGELRIKKSHFIDPSEYSGHESSGMTNDFFLKNLVSEL